MGAESFARGRFGSGSGHGWKEASEIHFIFVTEPIKS